ncbi:hypothetical protein PABG_07690 [Paracoccidioides brasiliensis Pb03]|nr:hypothetical protein PABG_07690 [Paracoccidioides brasiliensis Pb03]
MSVKKAFVKTELIRFVQNSSLEENFLKSRQEFCLNLRRRGYPEQNLDDWFRLVSYAERARILHSGKSHGDPAPLLLPSEYNPVWEYIDMKELTRTIKTEWAHEPFLPELFDTSVIKSLRRTQNLGALFSSWNRQLLKG